MCAKLLYDRILVLVHVGRRDATSKAAQRAVNMLPGVRRYLMRERVHHIQRRRRKRPEMDRLGTVIDHMEKSALLADISV